MVIASDGYDGRRHAPAVFISNANAVATSQQVRRHCYTYCEIVYGPRAKLDADCQMASRLVVLVAVVLAAAVAADLEKYSTKFDYLNVDQILKNNRLVKSYYNCLVDRGPCTQEGFEFRKTLPDALKTRCKKCNSLQRKNARKVVEYIMKNKPDMWQGVLKKYDPTGVLTKNLFADDFLG